MSQRRAGQWQAWLVWAVVLPLAGWVMHEAQRVFRAEWATLAAREQVDRWAASPEGNASTPGWNAALEDLLAGLALTPDDPALHERLGDLYSVAGRRDWASSTLRVQHYRKAASAYENAAALRPGSAVAWAALASARQAMAADAAQVHAAWRQARKLGPFEGHVQPLLLQVVLADWDAASPAMQDWAKALFDRSDAPTQAQINVLAKYYGLAFTPDTPAKAP